MYTPEAFVENDLSKIHALMDASNFATLVTVDAGVPLATHLPLVLDRDRGPNGTLRGHIARANPQWMSFSAGQEALVIFQGPHAYISPAWYETVLSVPTWNYVAVHAYGEPILHDDGEWLRELLRNLVERQERSFAEPWSERDLPREFLAELSKAIVGVEIPIRRVEGKWKLSQNRTDADILGPASGVGTPT